MPHLLPRILRIGQLVHRRQQVTPELLAAQTAASVQAGLAGTLALPELVAGA